MCGRFAFFAPAEAMARAFGLLQAVELPARYNIAPTQMVAVVRSQDGSRRLGEARWGLIPSWAKDKSIGNRTINARAETVAEKPSFRKAFTARRCVVPASGYYEWTQVAGGKQPWFIQRADREPIAFAGLWETWHDREADTEIESCTILTTAANAGMRELHHRMPVILEPEDIGDWLSLDTERTRLDDLMQPGPEGVLGWHTVSKRVNTPKEDDEGLVLKEGLF